jgi:hypothetical protein
MGGIIQKKIVPLQARILYLLYYEKKYHTHHAASA